MTSMLSAEELNDFIRPSAACTRPVEEGEKEEKHFQLEVEDNEIDYTNNNDNNRDSGKVKKISKAQISLTDCLACSGCVTSSEEVLIAQHSYNEFIKYYEDFNNKNKKYVLSISDQCRASIAVSYNVKIKIVDLVLARIFGEKFKFKSYVPINIGREIIDNALYEEVKNNKIGGPILSGSCPGWLVYANKTHKELGPQLSGIKSPMGIVGGILRSEYGKEMYHLSVMPCFDKKLEASGEEDVDMVITPRELVPLLEEYGIDLGDELSRGYCEEDEKKWLSKKWWGERGREGEGEEDDDNPFNQLLRSALAASGGSALRYCLRVAAEAQQERDSHSATVRVVVVAGRNRDVCEMRVVVEAEGEGEGEGGEGKDSHVHVIARAGLVNGFKNIQNLVRRLGEVREKEGGNGLKGLKGAKGATTTRRRVVRKRERGGASVAESASATGNSVAVDLTQCALVEVNACPGGCANGGGLFAPPEGEGVSPADWLTSVVDALAQIQEKHIQQQQLSIDTKRTSLLPQAQGTTPTPTTQYSAQNQNQNQDQDPLVVAAW